MNPEELKYLIYYLRYRHHEKNVLFTVMKDHRLQNGFEFELC